MRPIRELPWKRRREGLLMTTDVPAAIATEISAIAGSPEGERLTKMIGLARMRGAGPDELLAAELAGIYMDPVAYRRFDNKLGTLFRNASNLNFPQQGNMVPEVVIGSGVHAAVYCAIRHLAGFQKPYVLEASATVGGVFAVTQNPSFYLNSEITGGLPGTPWDDAANTLNWVPGAPVQPGQLSARELCDNTVMRYVIRTALALHARVVTRARVSYIAPQPLNRLNVFLSDGRALACRRVIDARGLGPDKPVGANTDRVLTWTQAMRQANKDVPFADMAGSRVAIMGGGKSAYCAAESLLGIGPDTSMRTAAGIPRRVDMFAPGRANTRERWLAEVQTRYARLAAHLPVGPVEPDDDGQVISLPGAGLHHDLYVISENAYPVAVPDGVLVNGRFYTHAISCTGQAPQEDLLQGGTGEYVQNNAGGRFVGTKAYEYQVFRVGPVADLPWAGPDFDSGITANPENRVSMHRLTPLTATLAASLPAAVV